jgi:hypothetical protein
MVKKKKSRLPLLDPLPIQLIPYPFPYTFTLLYKPSPGESSVKERGVERVKGVEGVEGV